jgi:gliding motility-associated-like protein
LLELSGQTGDILNWEFSIDGGISWNTLNLLNDTLLFDDVFTTTQYQAVVQNGDCPSVFSSISELTVIAGSDAGYITGEDTVCNAKADSLLSLNSFYGNIESWIYSSDNGATWIDTQDNNASFSYASLLGFTIFGTVVKEGNCPSDTTFHPIVVLPTSVSGGPNVTIFEGDSIQLQGSGGVSYLWSPTSFMDNETSQNPIIWPETDVTYSVEVTDQYNCKDTAFVFVQVNPDLQNVIVPNLLTPNGDGFNDTWEITNIETYQESEVHIFNAYGKVIYQAAPYLNDWQATFNNSTLPDGTYFYIIKLNNDLAPLKGTLTIVSKK